MRSLLCFIATASAFRGPPLAKPLAQRAPTPQMLSIPQIAAGANLASFGIYGAALLLKPSFIMRDVMRDDQPAWEFSSVPYAIAQYLGAVYLSQAGRMVRALRSAAMLKSDLLGIGIIQLFLCLTSLGRLIGGLERNSVSMSLPVGQGFMSALAFYGSSLA